MFLDLAVGKPNFGMFRYKANGDTLPGTHQNRITRKLLDCFLTVTFRHPEEHTVDVHGMQPRAAVFEDDLARDF